MSNEVSNRFAAALAIRDNGQISFGEAEVAALSPHFFAVGRLLSQKKKKLEPNAVIGTLTSVWDLGNRLHMREVGDQFVLRITHREDRQHVLNDGTWFYGRAMFAVAEYNGLVDAASVPITTFPVWVEVIGLPPALMTIEAVELLGTTLGHVDNLDRLGITTGRRAKVIHRLSDPIRATFPPMTYEFGSATVAANLSFFQYAKEVGFCRVCDLMEHLLGGCGGPPDTSGVQRVGMTSPTPVRGGVPSGFGNGSVRTTGECSRGGGSVNSNPRAGTIQARLLAGLGVTPSRSVSLPSSPVDDIVGGGRGLPSVDLFGTGGRLFGGASPSSFAFTIPGMSSAEMAANFARMCGTATVLPESRVMAVVAAPQAVVVAEPITGVKRSTTSEVVTLGKRVKGSVQTEVLPFELSFAPELALVHEDGHIKVSRLKKRRGGRPSSSKNKPKVVVGEQVGLTYGPKKAKRRYKTKRALEMPEVSGEVIGSGSSSVLECSVGFVVGGVLQAAAHGGTPTGDTIA